MVLLRFPKIRACILVPYPVSSTEVLALKNSPTRTWQGTNLILKEKRIFVKGNPSESLLFTEYLPDFFPVFTGAIYDKMKN